MGTPFARRVHRKHGAPAPGTENRRLRRSGRTRTIKG